MVVCNKSLRFLQKFWVRHFMRIFFYITRIAMKYNDCMDLQLFRILYGIGKIPSRTSFRRTSALQLRLG